MTQHPQPVHPSQLDVEALVADAQPKYDQVPVEAETRLDTLLALYAEAKPAADAAAKELQRLKDSIKLEMSTAAPAGSTGMEVRSPSGVHMRLTYSESTGLDTAKLKQQAPDLWKLYGKTSGRWTLSPVGGAQ